MGSRQLITDIKRLERRLNLQRSALQLNTRQRQASLRRLSPFWLLGGGLLAGVLLGRLAQPGQQGIYAVSLGGLKVWRLFKALGQIPD